LQVRDFSALECLHGSIPDRSRNRYASAELSVSPKKTPPCAGARHDEAPAWHVRSPCCHLRAL